MKVLLLGASGMLGQAIASEFRQHGDIDLVSVAQSRGDVRFDLADASALNGCLHQVAPDVIINAAAMVNLAACEQDAGRAYLVNARPSSVLSEYCREHDAYHVYVSTDHYFCHDGRKKHAEGHPVRLVNEYARSKYLGECLARLSPRHLILRTNIVGFRNTPGRPTFVEWVIGCLQQHAQMTLFTDFYTSSLDVRNFSRILLLCLGQGLTGTYHLASCDVSSKKEFILQLAEALGFAPDYVDGRMASGTDVPRADSLGLDVSKLEAALGIRMPDRKCVIDSLAAEYWEGREREIP